MGVGVEREQASVGFNYTILLIVESKMIRRCSYQDSFSPFPGRLDRAGYILTLSMGIAYSSVPLSSIFAFLSTRGQNTTNRTFRTAEEVPNI